MDVRRQHPRSGSHGRRLRGVPGEGGDVTFASPRLRGRCKRSSTASAARFRDPCPHPPCRAVPRLRCARHSGQGIGLVAADGRAPARVLISVTGLGRRTRRGLPVASEHRISGARNVRCSAAFCVRDRIGSDIVVFQQRV